ncbi:sigma-70 family RNA polymerase sigma factor [Mucilaginibacter sp. SP1R1]|uniref:sigma-70 family RNA polymerase sigma factor n=1 Tax=Mucilaginibacter sp. SP1R1 TaxID=2723091 RepID=UPI00160AFA3C|nr:sigma-70 family RNA polymerase sigma factor [Mucilaginibacter sp. SP1R1]MBB6150350.1 RNA polymerase sigma-70 factor (ECF subfamily) [Mucilaginibacter sp. SP1R1]
MATETQLLNPRHWVKAHADYLYAYTLSRLNDDELAKDLVQETFLAALEKVDRFEGKSTERTWLTAILKNKIIDVYRKKSSGLANAGEKKAEEKQQDFFEEDNGHWTSAHAPQPFGIDNHDPLRGKEFNQILQRCMQKLPVLWMSVFTMKHIDDEATEFICSELKVTQANFWVIIHRAKLNLRACLQKNWI